MTPTCPQCQRPIPTEDINVGTDLAVCRHCNSVHKLSELLEGVPVDENIDLARPPSGAWCRTDGMGAVIGASHRSIGSALGILAFALFWNGIVSVFVFLVLNSMLHLLHVPVPASFPLPKMNGNLMGIGETLGVGLFLTPFILVGLALIAAFLMALAGRTEVRIHPGEGVLFTGIGKLGWNRRFIPETVKDVRIKDQSWHDNEGGRRQTTVILIETGEGKVIKFGSGLRAERRTFVAAALRKVLLRGS